MSDRVAGWLVVGFWALVIGLGLLYGLVRFVKWAWMA